MIFLIPFIGSELFSIQKAVKKITTESRKKVIDFFIYQCNTFLINKFKWNIFCFSTNTINEHAINPYFIGHFLSELLPKHKKLAAQPKFSGTWKGAAFSNTEAVQFIYELELKVIED